MKVLAELRKYSVTSVALMMALFAFGYAFHSQRELPIKSPPVIPSMSPFGTVVAGSGFVEPSTDSSNQAIISVGSQLSNIVVNVAVRIDQEVKAGDLLFELDSRSARADLHVREAALAAAEAQLRKLQLQPRPEEVPPMEAQLAANSASLATAIDVRDRDKKLLISKSISEQEAFASEQTVQNAKAQFDLAKANLNLLKAGAWTPDIIIAQTTVDQARTAVEQARVTLELLDIRAPVSGTILQINIRAGELVSATSSQSLIVMGNLSPLHVRVSIDEEDIPRIVLNSPAVAMLRGDAERREIPMTFVRIEPAVIPKASLTGANTERVDTRVMQLIYSIDPQEPVVKARKVLVGQLLDVFINQH